MPYHDSYSKNYSKSYSASHVLTKDLHHKKLSGVCGGVARYYQFPRLAVRIVTVIAFITLPVATGVAYLVAALLIPSR